MVVDDRETLEPVRRETGELARTLALTVLFHPRVERIGERVRLTGLAAGQVVPLSRRTPLFAAPRSPEARELGDPCLSRRPLHLIAIPKDGSVVIDPCGHGGVTVDGAPLRTSRRIERARLEAGVVLELTERIAVLLHLDAPEDPPADRLGLVGESAAIGELCTSVRRVAALDVPVLLRGETGTGKDLVARAVHATSPRASGPFVSVNCAAIPPTTAASELFGHVRGAFTGAAASHPGYFAQAETGTLFLDEIGATPAEIQPMLLRALESLEIQPLGSARARTVNVRLIAATDADLERAVDEGSFRAAVYHRLEGYQLHVPPLRDRRDDIGRLMLHFLRQELAAIGRLDRLAPPADGARPWLTAAFVARLARFDWPGNVRQLRNVVRQLVLASADSPEIRIDPLLERLLAPPVPVKAVPPALLDDEAIASALREHGHRVPAAAAALGISRSALYERIRASPSIRRAAELAEAEIASALAECSGDVAAAARRLDVSPRVLSARIRQLGMDVR